MKMPNSSGTLWFHGSRADFDAFDHAFVGTGERAGIGFGFYLVNSLKGATAHAKSYAKQHGNPIVYVIRMSPDAKILTQGKPISSHSPEILQYWDKALTFNCYLLRDNQFWFDDFWKAQHPDYRLSVHDDKEVCSVLFKAGFDAIKNVELVDGYLNGSTILVLNPGCFEIIEKLPVEAIYKETLGASKDYYLSDTREELGSTGILSYLRRVE